MVEEIKDKKIWEDFLLGCKEKTFLQSWNWGEFQERMGNKIWRLGIYDGDELISTTSITTISAKRGKFLLIQHGPNIKSQISNVKSQILKTLLEKLKEIGREEKCDFIRVQPILENSEENEKIFQDLGFRKSPMHANAYSATWKLDITIPEEELLANMRKTTRYLIRQAIKNPDITIEKSPASAKASAGRDKVKDIEIYQKLNQEVAKRQKFTPFSQEYIKNEFGIFSRNNQASLFLGEYNGEVVSGALIVFWSGVGFYHQAASDVKYARLSIPYLLQWEAIKEAKRRGCVLYDFWGFTDPEKYPKHPWAGPTLFKMGFGGRVYEYIETQDFPLSKKYWLTYIFEMLRKVKRGL